MGYPFKKMYKEDVCKSSDVLVFSNQNSKNVAHQVKVIFHKPLSEQDEVNPISRTGTIDFSKEFVSDNQTFFKNKIKTKNKLTKLNDLSF